MKEIDFLLDTNNSILEVDIALVDPKEVGLSIVVGDESAAFEIVLTLSELKDIVKILKEESYNY